MYFAPPGCQGRRASRSYARTRARHTGHDPPSKPSFSDGGSGGYPTWYPVLPAPESPPPPAGTAPAARSHATRARLRCPTRASACRNLEDRGPLDVIARIPHPWPRAEGGSKRRHGVACAHAVTVAVDRRGGRVAEGGQGSQRRRWCRRRSRLSPLRRRQRSTLSRVTTRCSRTSPRGAPGRWGPSTRSLTTCAAAASRCPVACVHGHMNPSSSARRVRESLSRRDANAASHQANRRRLRARPVSVSASHEQQSRRSLVLRSQHLLPTGYHRGSPQQDHRRYEEHSDTEPRDDGECRKQHHRRPRERPCRATRPRAPTMKAPPCHQSEAQRKHEHGHHGGIHSLNQRREPDHTRDG